jgi:SAM-dependent methyltransferase
MSEVPNETASSSDFEFAALELARNYRGAVLREFTPYLRGDVLEVGAGIGHFSRELSALHGVTSVIAVEPSPARVRAWRARPIGATLIEGTVDAVDAELAFDALVSINVLEHIRADQLELAKYAARLSRRRGHLCLFVPARPELYAPIDRHFGHHRRYRKGDLRDKLEAAGFEVLRLHYFNWPGYFAWWLNFRVLERLTFRPASVELFDRVIFPWVHACERHVARPPFGQSLLAISRARSIAS